MTKIAVILTPEFADWEYALLAGAGVPFYSLDVRFFAPEPGEMRSQGGLTAVVEHRVNEIPVWTPDALAVIGGMGWTAPDAPDLAELLRVRYADGAVVAGICGGTLALARAGLLDSVTHTSNDLDFLQQNAPAYSGSGHYRQSPRAVTSERVITAPGTAPVSFTAAVFQAVGVDPEGVAQFEQMLAAEHA